MTPARRHWLLTHELPRLNDRLEAVRAARRRAGCQYASDDEGSGDHYAFDEEEQRLIREVASHTGDLAKYQVCPTPVSNDRVKIDHVVGLTRDGRKRETLRIHIVGHKEGDPNASPLKVSYDSEQGKELIGAAVNDDVEVFGKKYGGGYTVTSITPYVPPKAEQKAHVRDAAKAA